MSTRPIARSLFVVASMLSAHAALADATPTYNANITEAEVLAAQNAWGAALLQIGKVNETEGHAKAKELASAVLDGAYGYNLGPVLFKPTLAEAPHTFRTTKDGALSYFVGGDSDYPKDTGFALKAWQAVEIKNVAIHINGDVANTMGNVIFTGKDGSKTAVDKTWTFKKTDDGKLRIVLHHSSLPYSPN